VGVAVDNAVSLKWVKFDGALVGVSIKLQTIGYTTFCSFVTRRNAKKRESNKITLAGDFVVFIYLFIYYYE